MSSSDNLPEFVGDVRPHHRQRRQSQRKYETADDVGHEDDAPQPAHADKPVEPATRDDGKHRGQHVLGEELLASEDDDEKSDGIAKLGNDGAPL